MPLLDTCKQVYRQKKAKISEEKQAIEADLNLLRNEMIITRPLEKTKNQLCQHFKRGLKSVFSQLLSSKSSFFLYLQKSKKQF